MIADALEAPSIGDVDDPIGRSFRIFAEQTKSDLKALAACTRGSRQALTREQVASIRVPVLVAVGSKDDIAGPQRSWRRCARCAGVGDRRPRPHAGGGR